MNKEIKNYRPYSNLSKEQYINMLKDKFGMNKETTTK